MYNFLKKGKEKKKTNKPYKKIVVDINFPKHEDYLGKAADAKINALQSVKEGKYDKAWGLFQNQKKYYIQHALECKFTEHQMLALEVSVDEHLANILRLEGNHGGAFLSIMRWVVFSGKTTKAQEKKLSAYFNRVKLKNTTIEEVRKFIDSVQGKCEYKDIEDQVQKWLSMG